MGKTSLAREAADWWRRTGMFPHGSIFISLEGNPSPQRVVSLVGEAVEGIDFYKRDEADGREFLAEKFEKERWLIVWDNYESVLESFQRNPSLAPANPKRVFLSHSSQDKPLVRRFAESLQENGIEVWLVDAAWQAAKTA